MKYLKYSTHLSLAFALLMGSAQLEAAEVELISVENDNRGSSRNSDYPSSSADGHYVVFESQMTNLVDADTNGDKWDIFLRDRQTGNTSLVSVDSNGIQGNEDSRKGVISANGRFVVFTSRSRLVPEDTDYRTDVYLRDLEAGTTERVNVDSNFAYNATIQTSISDDGRYVAFQILDSASRVAIRNDAGNIIEYRYQNGPWLYVRDRQEAKTSFIETDFNGSEANGYNHNIALSGDGQYLTFHSTNAFLVANDNNGVADIFVHNLQTHETSVASIGADGSVANGTSYNPSISFDGRYITFQSFASNLVDNDTNGQRRDMFRHDRLTGETILASVANDGSHLTTASDNNEAVRSMSNDGRFIIFRSSKKSGLLPENYSTSTGGNSYAFVRDIQEGTTTLVSPAKPDSRYPWLPLSINSDVRGTSISPDGNVALFASTATNLVEPSIHGYNMRVYAYQLASSNQSPLAQCQDKVVEAGEQCLAMANIDNGSSDPDGDELLLTQTPSGLLGMGIHDALLTVSDGVAEASCSATITVEDTTAPQITAAADVTVEAEAPVTNVVLEMPSTDDSCGVSYIVNNAPNGFPLGATQVTWTAGDSSSNTSTDTQTVTIVDTTAPSNLNCHSTDNITPPSAPVSFTATATDAVSEPVVNITGYDCFMINKAGKRVDKRDACVISYQNDTLTILETGGVGTKISWTFQAEDSSGNQAESGCSILVKNPGKGKKK